jgi:hypothetical protein
MSTSQTDQRAAIGAAAGFRRAVERGDIEAIGELLAEEVVLHSPVTFHPFIGRETVKGVLTLVSEVFEDFHYTDELQGDGVHGLIFRAIVAEKQIEGLDLLRCDADGQISDLTVMLRPLSALLPFAQAMGERVAQAGLQTTRA